MNVSKLLITLKLNRKIRTKVSTLKRSSLKKVVRMDLRIFHAKTSSMEKTRIENPNGKIHK
jgi:hypothetical protein